MKQYLVVITCDVNDGDYIKSHFVSTEEGLDKIRKYLNTTQRLKQSYHESEKNEGKVRLCYKDNLPYYGDMIEPILQLYEWGCSEDNILHLEWVKSLPQEDIADALSLYDLLPYFDNEIVHTINSVEAYEITGEKLDLI